MDFHKSLKRNILRRGSDAKGKMIFAIRIGEKKGKRVREREREGGKVV